MDFDLPFPPAMTYYTTFAAEKIMFIEVKLRNDFSNTTARSPEASLLIAAH